MSDLDARVSVVSTGGEGKGTVAATWVATATAVEEEEKKVLGASWSFLTGRRCR